MSVRLSFCIPTYNFGKFIGETLRSIIRQADERVQIVIVDGGSRDETPAVVEDAAARFPRIKYLRHGGRFPIDDSILESVAEADGDYCWLFSSDDVLADGALSRAMKAIDEGGWDVFLTGMTRCDFGLNPLRPHPILDCVGPATFDWSDPARRADYFRRARTTTAFFSFISDIIVRRDKWAGGPAADAFMGSCWIIAAKLFAASAGGLLVRFDPWPFVLNRGDNDSFASGGVVRRLDLSLRGFRELAWHYFGRDSAEAAAVSRVVRNEYPLLDLLELKRRAGAGRGTGQLRDFRRLVRLHCLDGTLRGVAEYALLRCIPVRLLSALRATYLSLASLRRRLGA